MKMKRTDNLQLGGFAFKFNSSDFLPNPSKSKSKSKSKYQ